MLKKNQTLKYKIYLLIIILIILLYQSHHKKNVKTIESHNYYNMITALKENDIKTAKKYAKELIYVSSNKIYHSISYLLLYNLAKNKHNIKKSKKNLQKYKENALILRKLITLPDEKNI